MPHEESVSSLVLESSFIFLQLILAYAEIGAGSNFLFQSERDVRFFFFPCHHLTHPPFLSFFFLPCLPGYFDSE